MEAAIAPAAREELQKAAGFRNREHFVEICLKLLLTVGWLEMTIPDKPRSSKQRYRITPLGRAILKKKQEEQ